MIEYFAVGTLMQCAKFRAVRIAELLHIALRAVWRVDTLFAQRSLHRALIGPLDIVRRAAHTQVYDVGNGLRRPSVDQFASTTVDALHRRAIGRAMEIGDEFARAIGVGDAARLQRFVQRLAIRGLTIRRQARDGGVADIAHVERTVLRWIGPWRVVWSIRRIAVAPPHHLRAFLQRAECVVDAADISVAELSRQIAQRHTGLDHILDIQHGNQNAGVEIAFVIIVELAGGDQLLRFAELLLQRLRHAVEIAAHLDHLAPGFQRIGCAENHSTRAAADFVQNRIRSAGGVGQLAVFAFHALEDRERASAVNLFDVRAGAILHFIQQRIERGFLPEEQRVVAVLNAFEVLHELRAVHLVRAIEQHLGHAQGESRRDESERRAAAKFVEGFVDQLTGAVVVAAFILNGALDQDRHIVRRREIAILLLRIVQVRTTVLIGDPTRRLASLRHRNLDQRSNGYSAHLCRDEARRYGLFRYHYLTSLSDITVRYRHPTSRHPSPFDPATWPHHAGSHSRQRG